MVAVRTHLVETLGKAHNQGERREFHAHLMYEPNTRISRLFKVAFWWYVCGGAGYGNGVVW